MTTDVQHRDPLTADACPSWCEGCWEITFDVTKHTKRFNIRTTWHPVLKRWDHLDLTLDVYTGVGALAVHREPRINFNMVDTGPDEARKVIAAMESALALIDRELEEREEQAYLLEQEAGR